VQTPSPNALVTKSRDSHSHQRCQSSIPYFNILGHIRNKPVYKRTCCNKFLHTLLRSLCVKEVCGMMCVVNYRTHFWLEFSSKFWPSVNRHATYQISFLSTRYFITSSFQGLPSSHCKILRVLFVIATSGILIRHWGSSGQLANIAN